MGYIIAWSIASIGPFFVLVAGFAFLYVGITQTWDRRSSIVLAVAFLVIGLLLVVWRFTQPFLGPFTFPFT